MTGMFCAAVIIAPHFGQAERGHDQVVGRLRLSASAPAEVGLQPDMRVRAVSAQDLLRLRAPLALQHDRHAMDHDVEEAADQQAEDEDQADPDDRVRAHRRYNNSNACCMHCSRRTVSRGDITQENAAQCAAFIPMPW